jgi:cyclophilin family peptidyl-prolyl cis-trans isomerase/HEAT repeat protein
VLQGALTSKDVPVVQAALVALGQIGGPVALEALIRQIIYGKDPWLKETAITAIGRVDPDRAAAIAAGLSKESEPLLRAAAVRNLTGRTDPASEEILARVLDDPDVRVQVAAVLARAGADGPLDRLLGKTPKSPDPAVREAVANIAGLRLARSGSTEEERSEAFAVLDRVWESSANDALPIARAEVLEAATRAGKDPRVHAVLVRGLGDRDRQVRLRAIETLKSLYEEDHRERAGPAANRPVEDYVEILRWASRPRAAIVTMARGGFAPGRFTVRLDPREAPLASWNFAQLASRGFYDGLFVHRVVPGFVVQDGDPRGDGNGDAGYAIRDEIGRHPFRTGTVGMASSGRDTAGSQWFVLLSPQPHLDGRYTAFGEVVQNLVGVAAQILPGDRVTSIRVYEGDGTERLPPL